MADGEDIELTVGVLGYGIYFNVTISSEANVKNLIKAIVKSSGNAEIKMTLYLACNVNGEWLEDSQQGDMYLRNHDTPSGYAKMRRGRKLKDYGLSKAMLETDQNHIHVLMKVEHALLQTGLPNDALGRTHVIEEVCVVDYVRGRSLPGVEFMDALDEDVGFKIPVVAPRAVRTWPDVLCLGAAEYLGYIDSFLSYGLSGGSEMAVVNRDSNWLQLFNLLCNCTMIQDEVSSRPRPEAIITKNSVLVGKWEAKASALDLEKARMELTEKMATEAYRTFPNGTTSIPAWTSCYFPSIKNYDTKLLKTYHVTQDNNRLNFILDVFKILKWIIAIEKPNQFMHLLPGVRKRTTNGHYITWLKTGLIKEFRGDAKINLDIIRSIYNAKLQHVERGYCNHVSITITSIGQILENFLHEFEGNRELIVKQVRDALDELHNFGLAHCDVRAANVFVLLSDNRVILGDLEYCRTLTAPPPDVQCSPKDKLFKTALELDEYQFHKFLQLLVLM